MERAVFSWFELLSSDTYPSYPFLEGIYIRDSTTVGDDSPSPQGKEDQLGCNRSADSDAIQDREAPPSKDEVDSSLRHTDGPNVSRVHKEMRTTGKQVEVWTSETSISSRISMHACPFVDGAPSRAITGRNVQAQDDPLQARRDKEPKLLPSLMMQREEEKVGAQHSSQLSQGEEKASPVPRKNPVLSSTQIPLSSPFVPVLDSPCPVSRGFPAVRNRLKRARTSANEAVESARPVREGIYDWLNVDYGYLASESRKCQRTEQTFANESQMEEEPSSKAEVETATHNVEAIENSTRPVFQIESSSSPPLDRTTSQTYAKFPSIEFSPDPLEPEPEPSYNIPLTCRLTPFRQLSTGKGNQVQETRDRLAARASVLKRPFKSPMKTLVAPAQNVLELPSSSQTIYDDEPHLDQALLTSSPAKSSPPRKTRRPFKSPIGTGTPNQTSRTNILDIQGLERKVQVLRRAIKILAEEDEAELEALGRKWQEKGREVANQLWTESSRVENSWGGTELQSGEGRKLLGVGENYHEKQESDKEEGDGDEEVDGEVGALLVTLGVPPEALGWGKARSIEAESKL